MSSPAPITARSTIAFVLTVVTLLLVIAAVFGIGYLPDPYYAVAQLALYAMVLVLVGFKLNTCFRLAKVDAHKSALYRILFWIAMSVLILLGSVDKIFKATDRSYINVATWLGVYLALNAALDLVEKFLREHKVDEPAPSVEPPAPPAQ